MSSIIKSSYIVNDKSFDKEINKEEYIKELENLKEETLAHSHEEHKRIIEDAEQKAQNIIAKARDEERSIIKNAKNQSHKIIEDFKQQGYDKGYQEGRNKSEELIIEANEIKRQYLNQRDNLIEDLEEQIITLVMNIVKKIIGQIIEEDEEAMISIISKGLSSLNARANIIVRVSKDDYDVVDLAKERILSMSSLVDDIDIKVDNNLDTGDCVIDTPKGSVDVSVQSQINEMKNLLTDLLNGEC